MDRNEMTLVIDGVELLVSLVERHYGDRREFQAKTRVHTWSLDQYDAEVAASEAALPEPKIKGEDAENDRAYNKHNRLYAKKAKALAEKVLAELVEREIVRNYTGEIKGSFSRYAGCSCPCSPGVRMNTRFTLPGYTPVDVHISPVKRDA